MSFLLVGSQALGEYIEIGREPKDHDIWTDEPEYDSFEEYDGKRVEKFWHDGLIEFFRNRPEQSAIATLDELYTIKCSHAGWELRNGSWDKHMSDIVALKNAGAVIQDDQFKRLYTIWQDVHGSKQLKLAKGKDDFFTDAVVRKYDHDSLHASVAYGSEPMYIQTLKPGSDVDVDMKYIKSMPFTDQIKLFREEVYATALERKIIPSNYTMSPRKAYAWALRRTITSLTKGWSSRFLIENYDIMRKPDIEYVVVHLRNQHKLIPLEGQ
jgi:hypothetical protein